MSSDLELARAAGAGDTAAIAEIERLSAEDIARALGRLRIDSALGDEIRQHVREKLFVGPAPKIASYEGKGPLGAFIRAVVVHAAISAKRKQKNHAGDSALDFLADGADPELARIKARYGASFKQAFQDALATLSARERNLLRLVHVEGMPLDQVSAMYGVHRVSVSRWLGTARTELHDRTRRLLAERLSLDPSELASVQRLCLSAIDVSLARLL